jgi:hypothetical protein
MSERASLRVPAPRWALARLVLGLAVTPAALALARLTFPALQFGERLAGAVAFAGATLFPILGLALAATAELPLAFAIACAVPAGLALFALAWAQPAAQWTMLIVDVALVSLGWALGSSLGRRVQDAAHLLPACVVAASADLASLLSPEGPSHAIAASERALSVLATWFPVPGGEALAPALGLGDLLFMGLVLGVARAHGLPYLRCVAACLLGTALAGFAAARFAIAIPALVPIAAAVVLGVPRVRRLKPADRGAARLSMVIAATIALAVCVRSYLLQR